MIRISQIDDEFSIYKENTVVLLGIGHGTRAIFDLFKYHKIDINYICDNNKENFGKILEGIPVISPAHLQQLAQSENNQMSGGGLLCKLLCIILIVISNNS